MGAGARRNEICGCGSGLKVKDCPSENPAAFDKYARGGRPRPLSGPLCLEAAAELRSLLDLFEITLPPGSDLERMIRTIEALGREHSGLFYTAPLNSQQKLDVRYIDQVTKLAAVLKSLRSANVTGRLDRHLAYFRKRLDKLRTLDEQAQDILLELDVGAALANAGVAVTFAEPDIVIDSGSVVPKIAIPCKRPRRINSVDGAVRSEVHQGRESGLPSVIVLSLDAVVNRGDDGKPLEFWATTSDALDQGATKRFDDAVASAQSTIDARTDPSVIGLIWLARVPGAVIPVAASRERPSYDCPSLVKGSINRRHWEGRPGPLLRLHRDLFRGLP